MAASNLYYTGEAPAQTGKGHGTDVLDLSNNSDSGSDVVGGSDLGSDIEDCVDEDPAVHPYGNAASRTTSANPGDVNPDSDTDSTGMGEQRATGREPVIHEDDDLMSGTIRDLNNPEVDTPIDDENSKHAAGLAGENDDVGIPDAVELGDASIDPQASSRDLPMQSLTEGSTIGADNMYHSCPAYEGKHTLGQHHG